MSGNTNRSTTVSNAGAEGTDVASLVATSETEIVVLAVDGNVLVVTLAQLLDGSLDVLHSSGLTHSLGGVVGVASSTVPVTSEGLGVEGDLDCPLFGDTNKEVSGHPKVITHGNTLTRADLELPLGRHNLCVDTRNVDTGVEAGAIVRFDQVTSENLSGTFRD